MVSIKEKKRMSGFIVDRLEESGLYEIIKSENSDIVIAEKKIKAENPKTGHILLHNYKRTKGELTETLEENKSKGIYTGHIFYKDGENFMVVLGRRGHIKGDYRSLKRYSKLQIDAMIHLRDLEKKVVDDGFTKLAYYQPKTENLPESIRIYKLGNVFLDYTHLEVGDAGHSFAKNNTVSTDYKLPIAEFRIRNTPARMVFDHSKKMRAIIEQI